jgi:hypothetical protein
LPWQLLLYVVNLIQLLLIIGVQLACRCFELML